jgi:AraC-like DNA-binding protein
MAMLEGTRGARYDLVTAGHRFILAGLPLRHPESRQALSAFAEAAKGCCLTSPEREAVFLKLLSVVEPHTGGRLPSLVDRFLLLHEIPDAIERFHRCIDDVIRYLGIGNPHVQQAVAIVHERYDDPKLRQEMVAELVSLSPSALCARFRSGTGMAFTEYLREVRLGSAAKMLLESNKSIKEISWAAGYQDVANFDHDFKQRFSMTPTAYRARGIRPVPSEATGKTASPSSDAAPGRSGGQRILIVDDYQCTRETLGLYLRRAGYSIDFAASAREALENALTTNPSVIVLDFHLPDMDGLDCLRKLRRCRPGPRPPVALYTADWDVEECAEQAHALGAMILSKLSDMDEVKRVVASLCAMQGLH